MNFNELVETIIERPKKHPYFITLEGIIGSGKSHEAEKLKEELAGKTILLSTDLFVTVGRDKWTECLEEGNLDLRDWYDLSKIRETLESIKRKEKFYITGLYDIATGEFDDRKMSFSNVAECTCVRLFRTCVSPSNSCFFHVSH